MNKQLVRGYWLAVGSILLATFAQLAMKWGMSHLPLSGSNWLTFAFWWSSWQPTLFVFAGILAYLLSTVFWLGALTYIPLNKAYPLLSASYVLVYIATISLPWFNETFSMMKSLGVGLICIGVLMVVISTSTKKDI